jgi:hypothetical protein
MRLQPPLEVRYPSLAHDVIGITEEDVVADGGFSGSVARMGGSWAIGRVDYGETWQDALELRCAVGCSVR